MQQKEEEGKQMARVGAKLVQRGQDKAAAARANAKAALKSFAKDKMADNVPPPLNPEFNPEFAPPPPNADNRFQETPPLPPQSERNGPPPYEFPEVPQPYQSNTPDGAGVPDREP